MEVVVEVSNSKPTAGFTFSDNNVCGNTNIQFTDRLWART